MEHAPQDNQPPESVHLQDDSDAQFAIELSEQTDSTAPESLFELYEPRSVSTIIAQQHAQRESHAAEAAAIILEGIEPPEFDFTEATRLQADPISEHPLGSATHPIRVQKTSPVGQLVSPGAQFVYALIIITLLGGLIGLAATMNTPELVLIAGIVSPILLPICIWKWIRWLDSSPYYYRLLTSLGEDARNLINYRLLWKRAHQKT